MNNLSYPAIIAWSKMLGSFDCYIEAQVRQAQEDNAPADAIFRTDGHWWTVRDIENPDALTNMKARGIDVSQNRHVK